MLANFQQFELSNHLGNVNVVVSDHKMAHSSDNTTIDYYTADIISSTDYYPFGEILPGRNFNSNSYRFGFNGKENDNEVYGATGTFQDYGMRMYDTRTCRFISVDPITAKYPMLTPYQFASNTPIMAIDLDGLEGFVVHGTFQEDDGIDLSESAKTELMRITGNTQINTTFRWHSPWYNGPRLRQAAAWKLVAHIMKVRGQMLKEGKITKDEGISLIGYSHGGNVAIRAARILKRKYDVSVNLVTIATPAHNSTGDEENPEGNAGINEQAQIVKKNDPVVNTVGDITYDVDNKQKVINYVGNDETLPTDNDYETGSSSIGNHTNIYRSSKFTEFLKSVYTMSKSPSPKKMDKVIENHQ